MVPTHKRSKKTRLTTPEERQALEARQAEIGEQLRRESAEIRQDALLHVLQQIAEMVKGRRTGGSP
jgi:hypothetical protein